MKSIKTYLLFFLCALFYSNVFAQYTEVINSNRPGVSRSAFSVGTNVVQFEVGPYILKEEHTPLKYEVSGFGVDFSARYGLLLSELEINIEGTFQNDTFSDNRSTIADENDRSNFKYVAIGAKYLVYDPYKNAEEDKPNLYSWKANHTFKWSSMIPAVGVYAGVNYDTENNPYTAPGIEGISPKVMIATQNNFAGGWVFGETQGINSDFYADNLIRFGGAYLLGKDLQLDTALTFNTKDTPSVFSVNFGASYRLDFHKDKEEIDNNSSARDEGKRRSRERKNRKRSRRKQQDFEDDGGLM